MIRLISALILTAIAITTVGCHASADAGHGGAGAGVSVGG